MVTRKIVLSLLGIIMASSAIAAEPQKQQQITCIDEIIKSQDFLAKIDNLAGGRDLNQELVEAEKSNFYTLIADQVVGHCMTEKNLGEFNTKITKLSNLQLPFQKNNKYYQFNVSIETLFDYMAIPTAVVIAPFKNKVPGDKITKSDMPKTMFYTPACSDHLVDGQISNDSPVNVAGQSAFQPYAHREFFIDFPDSNKTRAFPGMLIASTKGFYGKEEVVWYSNYKKGRDAAIAFANALNGTPCSNQNLAIYVVKLDHNLTRRDNTWPVWARDVLGIASALTIFVLPIALKPKQLENLQSVVILDGPYLVK
ncbi:MAG: hypothetical protein J5742_04100 [Alphaproteobacteria bacterium]|nr:hypothetical protein [Alphaproteobacteria bacterium]